MAGIETAPTPLTTKPAFPFAFFLVAFAFTWTFWSLAVLDDRGLTVGACPHDESGERGGAVAIVPMHHDDRRRELEMRFDDDRERNQRGEEGRDHGS